jgi:hypothetical protein
MREMAMTEQSGPEAEERIFLAHPRDDRHKVQRVEAPSPLVAALVYAEHVTDTDADGRMAITVEDCASGERHCFVVDLDDGEVAAC